MKVLFLTNIPSPYRVRFFEEFAKYVELTVVYETDRATDRQKGWIEHNHFGNESASYQRIVLSSVYRKSDNAFCPGIRNIIKKNKFDRIIVGVYSTPTARYAIDYMLKHHIPYMISCDGGIKKEESVLKRYIKKHYISGAEGYFSSGEITDEYLMAYGADRRTIKRYPFSSVGNADILDSPLKPDKKRELQKDVFPGYQRYRFFILGVGQFIQRKGFDILLRIANLLPDDVGIYLVGGEQTQEYRSIIEQHQVQNVHFLPFRPYKDLQKLYRSADLFVLPTREDIWGLVVNEALANGLPVITTDRCVAGVEMISDGAGKIVEADNPDELLSAILEQYRNHTLIAEDRANTCLKIARKYTIEKMAVSYAQGVKESKVLFVGTRVSESELLRHESISAAANRYQEKLLNVLQNNVDILDEISYTVDSNAQGVTVDEENGDHRHRIVRKGQTGVPGMIKAGTSCLHLLKNALKDADFVICYNVFYTWLRLPVICRKYHRKSVLILADYSGSECYRSPIRKLYAKLQLDSIRRYDRVIGLSANAKNLLRKNQEFCLIEGGIDASFYQQFSSYSKRGEKITYLYSGLLNQVTGIHLLLEAMRMNHEDIRLIITGRGELEKEVELASKDDSRIEYRRLLPEEQYIETLKEADILINPRNMKLPENQNNFPSKIMDYLATGKRVISTRFIGHEKFGDIITFCDSTAEGLAKCMQTVLPMSEEEYRNQRKTAENYLWESQIKRMIVE